MDAKTLPLDFAKLRTKSAGGIQFAVLMGLILFSAPIVRADDAPGDAWPTIQKEVNRLTSSGNYKTATKLLSEYISAHPDFGPAYERRAWATMDGLDLRDEISLVDSPLRRRSMGDPAASLGNMDPTYEPRRAFLQEKFQDKYVAPPDLKQVEQDIEAATRLQGSKFDPKPMRAFIAEFTGDIAEARKLIGSRCAKGEATAREYLTFSRIQRAEGDLDGALKSIELALKSPEVRGQALSRKFNMLIVKSQLTPATNLINKWQSEGKPDPRLSNIRIGVLSDKTVAFQEFDRLLAMMPDEGGIYYTRSIRDIQMRGDYKASLEDLNRAVELNPTSIVPVYARSCLHAKEGDPKLAMDDANQVVKLNPYFDLGYQLRSKLSNKLGDSDGARNDKQREAWLKRLYELHAKYKAAPDNADALAAVGEHYARGEDWKSALKALNRALELNPAQPVALRERGGLYGRFKKYDLALADANRLAEISTDPSTYSLRGDVYAGMEDWDSAVKDYERAKSLDRLPVALRRRAAWHSEAGRSEEANADLALADELSESDTAPR